jgi:hypothetical protein
MNKRLLELYKQAQIPGIAIDPTNNMHYETTHFSAEKFAELIVRECMEQVWYTREDGINGNVSEVIKDRIKQHFGVEE